MKITYRLLPIILIQAMLVLILVSCTNAAPVDPTLVQQATLPPKPSSTATIAPTATITPEPTPTKEPPPARWDDPELLADVRAEFEAAKGMSVEDYYNKAVQEKRVSNGSSES